jgi:hypothetical protein
MHGMERDLLRIVRAPEVHVSKRSASRSGQSCARAELPAETPTEVTIGQEARRQDWIGMVADWCRVGVPEKAIEFAVKGGRFPAADAALVKNKFLPNAMALRDQGYDNKSGNHAETRNLALLTKEVHLPLRPPR